ncbi:MAG: hypothetical protein PHO10_11155 [Gemmiger sp.]|nr:hypothetical protein [Gemmiger sp.]
MDGNPASDMVCSARPSQVRLPDLDVPYIGAHNHASELTFSPGDIRQFIKRPNLKVLTAVGNDGTVYTMEKTPDFDATTLRNAQRRLKSEIGKAETNEAIQGLVQNFLEGADAYGLLYTAN